MLINPGLIVLHYLVSFQGGVLRPSLVIFRLAKDSISAVANVLFLFSSRFRSTRKNVF